MVNLLPNPNANQSTNILPDEMPVNRIQVVLTARQSINQPINRQILA